MSLDVSRNSGISLKGQVPHERGRASRGSSSRTWAVRLFGRFSARKGNANLEILPGRRATELLGYLLLFRERPHHREVLAGTLWPESSTAQSRKYLRQSLWHLRALGLIDQSSSRLLTADSDWIQAKCTDLWLDVAELEEAFALVKLVPGEKMDVQQAKVLKGAVAVYRGHLLEGCYEDWCIYERERLRAMHISLLEKLLGYCETHGETEEGLVYGEELLCHDRAHERAHRRLMRLRYRAGDRTGALRQFERCREALKLELGVTPGERTRALYEQIRVDGDIGATIIPTAEGPHSATAALQRALVALSFAGKLVEQSIQAAQQRDQ